MARRPLATICMSARRLLQVVILLCVSVVGLVVYLQTTDNLPHILMSSNKLRVGHNVTSRRPFRPTPRPTNSSSTEHIYALVQAWEPCTVHNRTGRSPQDGRWYNYSTDSFQFYAYTAILDDRPSLQSTPIIRIVAITTKLEDVMSRKITVSLYCRFYYGNNQSRIVAMQRDPKPVGFGWSLNSETAKEYVYGCPLDNITLSDGVPIAVSVLRSQLEHTTHFYAVTSCLPVELPWKPATTTNEQPATIAACVPVAFGSIPAIKLIEWLELQKLLGVTLIGAYSMHIRQPALGVLQKYADEGFVDLHYSDYIPHGPQQNVLHSTPVVNDCIYRHMYRFKYIAVIDFDELIIADNSKTLQQLLVNLDNSPNSPVNYVFRNSYFFTDIPANNSKSNLTLLRHDYKVALSPPGYSVKSIINPQACTNMHNHYCWGLTAGFRSRPADIEVDPKIATNRHFKVCHFNQQECRRMMSQITRDDVIQRLFGNELERRVNDRLNTDFRYLLST